jgi:hypothetical protein
VFEVARPGRSTNPLITSLMLHSLAALVLFTLHVTGGLVAIARARSTRVAPLAVPRQSAAACRPPPPQSGLSVRPQPRVFQAPPAPPPLGRVPTISPEILHRWCLRSSRARRYW